MGRWHAKWTLAAALLGAAWLAGCSNSGNGQGPGEVVSELTVVRGSGSVEARVGREGARLELEEGAAATFERDVLREPTDLVLRITDERDLQTEPARITRLLSPPVELRPVQLNLDVDIEIELPLVEVDDVPPSRIQVFRAPDETGSEWEELEVSGLDLARTERQVARVRVERGGLFVAAEQQSTVAVADPLTVDAGEDQEVDEGASFTLAGGTDSDGEVTTTWTQTSGPAVDLGDSGALSVDLSAPDVGQDTLLTFELSAQDAAGQNARDSVSILVRFVNAEPSAAAGDDQTVSEGAAVLLSGTASDADGGLTVAWTQLAGPEVTLAGADTLAPSFTAPEVAANTELVFQIEATDADGASATDTVRVAVEAVPNTLPVVNAGADQIVPEQTPVTLDGVASDGDGTLESLTWSQIGGGVSVALASLDVDSVGFDAPAVTAATALVFQLEAIDDEGGVSTDSVLVTITPVNAGPGVDAGAPQSLTEDLAGSLQGTADDSDGSIASVVWTQLSGSPATIDDPSVLTTSFTPPDVTEPEVLVFELEVTDDEGATARDTVTFNVLPIDSGNQPPRAYAGPDLVVASGTVSIDQATASDNDGSVSAIAWTQLSGTTVTGLTGQTTLTPSFDVSAVTCGETLVFQLEVQDDLGATSVDTVGILVNADYDSPVALGSLFDFEGDDGGFTTDGSVWALDVPTSGPNVAYSGNRVWATVPGGNYPNAAAEETLCLPTIDRAGQARVTVSFRLWSSFQGGDGFRIEALDPSLGWQPITEVQPAYADSTLPAWQNAGRNNLYALHTVQVPPSATGRPKLRFVFESNANFVSSGAYIDDVAVHSESEDPDGDGLVGIEDEWLVYGTDPFVADTDGDGLLDGAEVAAGTDPLNPATFTGADALTPPFTLDFDDDDGGLVAIDTEESPTGSLLWQHGEPSSGPSGAYSTPGLWATNLNGNYGNNERAYLYLPAIDLSATAQPTLSFRLWSVCQGSDGMRLEVFDVDTGNWVGVTPAFPAYNATDALGSSAYGSLNRQGLFTLVAFPLNAYAGEPLQARLAFRSNANFTSAGVYVDALSVHDESDDPDGDGLAGIVTEHETYGTDPFDGDTDGDGVVDGTEALDGTDPLDASDYASGPMLTVPTEIDFELSNGGFTSTTTIGSNTQPDDLWQYGAAASGPGAGHEGSSVWATNLSGNYDNDEIAYLNVPPIDLTSATDPTLSFRLWSRTEGGDGLSVEVYDDDTGSWLTAPVALPAYNGIDAAGNAAWSVVARHNLYTLVAVSLQPYVGGVARVRLAFRSNANFTNVGAYIDEFALYEESDDPDLDGIPGVIDERLAYGTDPFVADTDGDGVDDGTEAVADGTDPLDPAYYAGGPILAPGDLLDFESSGGGLASMQPVVDGSDWQPGTLWRRGTPGGNGPSAAYSGGSVWATAPAANHGDNERAYLHLPPIDLTGVADASLSMRLYGRVNAGDGLSVEVLDDEEMWSQLTPLTPAYNGTDAAGGNVPAWANVGYQSGYDLVIVPLTGFGNRQVRVRFVFRSNANFAGYGFAFDNLAVHDESSDDPDADSLAGVVGEFSTYGTDPLVADTDGDGFDDGSEDSEGTDPLNPADDPDAVAISEASGVLDFEVEDHDFATDGALWQYGSIASGPGAGASGTRGWATNLSGNFFGDAREYLYVPPVTVEAGADATFGFHMWMRGNGGDGLSCEIWDPDNGWQKLPAAAVPYQSTDPTGTTTWQTYYETGYVFGAVSLAAYAGETVWLRFAFRSNTNFASAGAYLDDFVLVDENGTGDPDGDGITGLLDEYLTTGTDPLSADTDGDGVDDSSDAAPLDDTVQ